MTRTRILPLAALALMALATFTPTSQAACIGIGVEGIPLQAESDSDSTSAEAVCIGVDDAQLPPEVVGLVNTVGGIVLGEVLEVIGLVEQVETPECAEAPPLFIPAECYAYVNGRVDPLEHYLTGEGEGTVNGWQFEVGEWNAATNQWANGYATYLSGYEANAQGGASSYAVAEGLSQMGYALGRVATGGSLSAEQAALVADWFGGAQAQLAAYVTTETNELAANEVSFVQEADAFLRGTESDFRAYAIALESYHVCSLGSDSCGTEPTVPNLREEPQHETHTPDLPPELGQPGTANWGSLVVGPTTQPYTPPGTPDTPSEPPEFPQPPEPPLEEEPES